jgi:NTP pyrophosphatase (non-canonical NTP hydrolase)
MRIEINKHEREILASAIRKFGISAQLRQLQEEAAEVIVAVNHFYRGTDNDRDLERNRIELLNECADLIIMLAQVLLFDGTEIEEILRRKMQQLKIRIG